MVCVLRFEENRTTQVAGFVSEFGGKLNLSIYYILDSADESCWDCVFVNKLVDLHRKSITKQHDLLETAQRVNVGDEFCMNGKPLY